MRPRQDVLCDQKTLCVTDSIALREAKVKRRDPRQGTFCGKSKFEVEANSWKFVALISTLRGCELNGLHQEPGCGWTQRVDMVIKERSFDSPFKRSFWCACGLSVANSPTKHTVVMLWERLKSRYKLKIMDLHRIAQCFWGPSSSSQKKRSWATFKVVLKLGTFSQFQASELISW